MRIIAGEFKGRVVKAPPGRATRPTAERVRESIFNVLEHAPWSPGLKGCRVIDLFAGSGALGFEALSRGAAFCLFVETDEAARGAIRDTVEAFGLFGVTRVHRRDAVKLDARPSAHAPFDLAFLDPPYGGDLAARALAQLRDGGWLCGDGRVVVETGVDDAFDAPLGFELLDARSWGAAKISFLAFRSTT